MRGLNLLPRRTVLGATLLILPGCERSHYIRTRPTVEEPPSAAVEVPEARTQADLASIVPVSDERLASQLVSGFHNLEQGAWRWTAGSFSVLLKPPAGSEQTGATLQLNFNFPDAVLSRIKETTLSANISGKALPPQTYRESGMQTYSREVPANAFKGEPVLAKFQLTRFATAGMLETRELGLIVTRIALEPK